MAAASGKFAVGEASIDSLHEECEAVLVRLEDDIAAQRDATVALERLQRHLERHFEHEQLLMSSSSFPPAACHTREHAAVLEVVAEVRRRYADGDRDPAGRLAEAMIEWFGVHAGSMDAALAQWLRAEQTASRERSGAEVRL